MGADVTHATRGPGTFGIGAPAGLLLPGLLESLREPALRVLDDDLPNLSELADGASWFQDARAVADSTHHALPAILTGNFPAAGRSPRLANHPQNLFTLFGGDYRIWAVEPVVKLCPPEINRVITESFQLRQVLHLLEDLAVVSLHLQLPSSLGERFLPPISDSWGGFAARDPKKELQRRRRANRSFKDYPDRDRLALRFERFKAAA